MSRRARVLIFVVWFMAFVGLSIATSDRGDSGEDGWSMCWGYPAWLWLWLWGDEQLGMSREFGNSQWVILCNKWSSGTLEVDVPEVFFAISVPLAPLVLGIVGHAWFRRGYRFHLDSLMVVFLVSAAMLGLDILCFNTARMISEEGV
jgi:hypothetical protein